LHNRLHFIGAGNPLEALPNVAQVTRQTGRDNVHEGLFPH